MTDATTRKCSHCGERFELTLRSGRTRSNRKRTLHKGRRYCSDNCRKRASDSRHQPSTVEPKTAAEGRPATIVASTVRSVDIAPMISMGYEAQKSGRASLKMTFGGYTVVPDQEWPGMYRIRKPDGRLTDMVNLTRARDAARCFAEQERRQEPLPIAA
jgi:hypothetical protein